MEGIWRQFIMPIHRHPKWIDNEGADRAPKNFLSLRQTKNNNQTNFAMVINRGLLHAWKKASALKKTMAGEGLNGSSNSAAKRLSNPYVGWTPQPLPQAIRNSTERNETRVPTGFPLVSDLFGERGERKMGVQSQKRVTNSRAIRRRPEHQYKSSTAHS